ncbi:MAG: DUF438 domain-containing protein [Nitrososphaerota archaeon]|nr:DUF438 domain-containing protein [Nitrososphaerota archaeon]
MSTKDEGIQIVKELLKRLHRGESIEYLKMEFGEMLARISPFEIPLIEQKLVEEGISVGEIARLCDLHVELFREHLRVRELDGVPAGHPLDLLLKENEWIMKQAEAVRLIAALILRGDNEKSVENDFAELKNKVNDLRKIRTHYVKIQMLLFPYLERRGIIAVPRVMWAREDQVRVKLRALLEFTERVRDEIELMKEAASKALEIAQEISDVVFRENKILFPTVWTLFSDGEWAAISDAAGDLGYIVEAKDALWHTDAKPILPYEVRDGITPDQLERLPEEFKSMALSQVAQPDHYEIKSEKDLDLGTGFLDAEEVKGLFKALPIELTYANVDDRVRFFTQSIFHKGFKRARTIIGRRLEFCHPPRLEKVVRSVVDEIKSGKADFREFWTMLGGRTIRVLIIPVKGDHGKLLGTVEIVEDLTEIINNPEEIKKKIMVL